MKIYLDTNLWNASYEQRIDPKELLPALGELGTVPVLGIHVVFELLKTFFSKSTQAHCRAQELFRHLESYLRAGLRCIAKDPIECLVAEMYGLKGPAGAEKFLDFANISNLTSEGERLASGQVKNEWIEHVDNQARSSEADRKRFAENLSTNLELRRKLQNVPPSDLRTWLKHETYSPDGHRLLFDYLVGRFPEQNTDELQECSSELLRSKALIAEALVRAGLYYNWRCAHRSSNPKDLLDDMYHVCNAAYCNVYASKERKQTDYAAHLLQSGTEIQIYESKQSLSDWLLLIGRRRMTDI